MNSLVSFDDFINNVEKVETKITNEVRKRVPEFPLSAKIRITPVIYSIEDYSPWRCAYVVYNDKSFKLDKFPCSVDLFDIDDQEEMTPEMKEFLECLYGKLEYSVRNKLQNILDSGEK